MIDAQDTGPQQPDAETLRRVAKLRSAVRENFGSVAMAMMALPRYRHLSIGDLQHLILEPMVQDRIALARRKDDDNPLGDVAGMAIWASVSADVDARIREQVSAGVFPIRLRPDEWKSGDINWLFDVIAPDEASAASVIANFRQVAKGGDLRLHPLVPRLVSKDILEKMGAAPIGVKA
ncbi:MAG: toxin-activating lysine-acyltransferase [Jannaschia sp.]